MPLPLPPVSLPLGPFGHPPFADLEPFADPAVDEPPAWTPDARPLRADGRDARARRHVARHLARCPRCQRDVRMWRTLRDAMRDAMAAPVPPAVPNAVLADGLVAVLRRHAMGDQVLLPIEQTPPTSFRTRPHRTSVTSRLTPTTRRRPVLARTLAGAAACLALAWAALRPSRTLEAGETAGTLAVTQRLQPDGRVLAVRYRPALALADVDSVLLRAALFPAGLQLSGRPRTVALRPQGDGTYAGALTLPPDVVRATFTVARPDGRAMDDNDARGWEVLAEEARGRPLFAALWQQYGIYAVADWERAYRATQAMLRFYPERPTSVRFALGSALELAGPARGDSVRAAFRPYVAAVDAAFSRRASLDDEALSGLVFLAGTAGDTAMERRWRERLFREAPHSAGAVQQRVFMALNAEHTDAARLAALDRLWDEVGGAAPQLPFDAFRLATAVGDAAAIERWGERLRARMPGFDLPVADAYAHTPGLRARGAVLLRTALRRLPPVTAAPWQDALRTPTPGERQPAQLLLTALGRALLADSTPAALAAARDTLERAAALGRARETLRALGRAALRAADTAAAATADVWLLADPRTIAAQRDSLAAELGAASRSAPFEAARRTAAAVYRDEALAAAVRRPVQGSPMYRTPSGALRSLAEPPIAASPGAAIDAAPRPQYQVVAFVSRGCAPSLGDLPALDRVRRRWVGRDGPAVPVVALLAERPDSGVVRALDAHGYHGAVGFDDRAAVARATRQAGTPQYVVVEDGRTVRYLARTAADVDAFLAAVLGAPLAGF